MRTTKVYVIISGPIKLGLLFKGCLFALCLQMVTLTSYAQYTKLLDFEGATNGSTPHGSLVSDGTFLYGTTEAGGTNNLGTIFKIMPDGTGYTKLLDFNGTTNGSYGASYGSYGSLFFDGAFLYGMTTAGGANSYGTVFKIMPDGNGYVTLLDFAGDATSGGQPFGSLISDGTFLYGMTRLGGTGGLGTTFKIKPDGTGYQTLLNFSGANGRTPYGSLVFDGTFLYGMTLQGGTAGFGTIFKIMPDGNGYVKLLDFLGGADARSPYGSLISDGTFLYGMTVNGATNNVGTIFKIKPDGTSYSILLDLDQVANGINPYGDLIFDGTFLYGMTSQGGSINFGRMFKIMPDGTGYTSLMDFVGGNGMFPTGSLISDGSFLYGMTSSSSGGVFNLGTIFKYALGPATPTITSFTPSSGPIGTPVTITGTNFSTTPANNIVYFGAVRATVTAASSAQLTVIVPAGATYQPITVQVAGLTAYSQNPFVTTFVGGGSFDACSFEQKVNFETNDGLSGDAFFGDIDGDGKVDVITAKRNINSISIYRNTSISGQITSSSFAPKIDVITGTNGSAIPGPVAFSFGDIDGDGKPDIAVVNYRGGTLAVFRNLSTSGTISLSSRVDFSIGDFGTGVSLRDIDGDGKLDAVVTSFFDGVSVLRNTATSGIINASTFANRLNFATGPNPYHPSIADFDRDGKLDIAVPNANNYTVSLLHNTSASGTVSFAPQQVVTYAAGTPALGSGTYPLSVGDLDGDGKIDLLVSNNTLFIAPIFRNTSIPGTITFAPQVDLTTSAPPAFASISDLDGDGKIDLAIYNGLNNPILVYKNSNVPGTISTPSFGSPIGFGADPLVGIFGSADIDGDGKNDIVNVANGFYVLRNKIGEAAPLTISSLTPTVGPFGTSVTITGTGFDPIPANNIVMFNGTTSVVSASTATIITTTVPTGATTGKISVMANCQSTLSASDFTVGTATTITITTQPANASACFSEIVTFTTAATGTTNITYQWERQQADFTFTDVINGGAYSGANTPALTVDTGIGAVSLGYRCRINGDLASQEISNTALLLLLLAPSAPTTTGATGCSPTSLSLTASGGTDGQYKWYTTPTGGSPITGEVNGSYTTPILSAATTYYVSLALACESTRTPVIADVSSSPTQPIITSSITPTGGNVSVCSSNILTLTAPTGFSSYSWSNGETTQQITISSSDIYSVVVTNSNGCASPASDAIIVTVIPEPCSNQPPMINPIQATTQIAGVASIDLSLLISDVDNNIDINSLKILIQPSSGALAAINNSILTINYSGLNFSGQDKLTIEVCDLLGSCTQQELTIEVAGELVIFTGISPNGDSFNEKWIIQNIESLPDTKENKVSIYNRWGDLVFEVNNYDNKEHVFIGVNKNGNELTSGVYFYKIDFTSGRGTISGYLHIRQ